MVTLLCKLLLPGMTVNFEIIMKVTQHVFSIKLQNGVNIEAIKLFNPICIKSFKIANLSVMFCSLKQVTSQQHQKSFVNPFAFFPLTVCMKIELYMWISRKIYLLWPRLLVETITGRESFWRYCLFVPSFSISSVNDVRAFYKHTNTLQ